MWLCRTYSSRETLEKEKNLTTIIHPSFRGIQFEVYANAYQFCGFVFRIDFHGFGIGNGIYFKDFDMCNGNNVQGFGKKDEVRYPFGILV